MAQSQDLKFVPWFTDIDLGFCPALAHLKINHDKLDDSARKVVGRYEVRPNEAAQSAARMSIPGNALTSDETSSGQCRAEGILRNVNTIEEYRALDKTAVLERAGRTIWDAIVDGTVYSCPSLLVSFYAVFFADLKKYKFTNRFAFPALHSDWKLATGDQATSKKLAPLETTFLVDAVQTWRYAVDARQHGFFLAKRRKALESEVEARRDDSDPPGEDEIRWTVGSLLSFEQGFFEGVAAEDAYVCFLDPSTYPQNPGVMLRNLLVLARQRWKLDKMQVLCYRDTHSRRERPNSLILQLVHPESAASQTPEMPRVTGWERYQNNRANSLIDLGEFMDPRRLADQAIDLNLKLMKWRIAPDLDLEAVKNTKCLLLGAGTLGSYVARNLLGWGVRKITFVDNARVSFSNPVRQPLYGFADCLAGGAPKATRAAAALREIYPGVDAAGVVMAVPMAGHPVPDADAAAAQADFEQLRALVDAHDVVFLLMDSRESRWLPTVMARAAGKLVMNAALGFDTYLVMRHGVAADPAALPELGCYFCNDVVAPVDCTVTRPGVAALASALLVELLVSTLQHPSRGLAPAPLNRAAPAATPLGLVPHAVRGFLAAFDNVLVHGPAFAHCSACSAPVAAAYAADGWAFVRRALAQPRFVEELCGLADVQRAADAAAEDGRVGAG